MVRDYISSLRHYKYKILMDGNLRCYIETVNLNIGLMLVVFRDLNMLLSEVKREVEIASERLTKVSDYL